MLSGIMKALYLFAWSHFLRRTGTHFAGKCSSALSGKVESGFLSESASKKSWSKFMFP
jgi:hypothetical protein